MNIEEEVKVYQLYRQDAAKYEQQLKTEAIAFFRHLLNVSTFANSLPNDVAYRKKRLQAIINSTLQSIELIANELQRLGIDCSLQIQTLISRHNLQKLREEHQNARTANSELVRQVDSGRESFDSEESSD